MLTRAARNRSAYAIVNRNDIADAMRKLEISDAQQEISAQIGHVEPTATEQPPVRRLNQIQ